MVEKFDRVLVKEVTVDGHLFSFRLHFFLHRYGFQYTLFNYYFFYDFSKRKIYEIATENHDMQVSFTSLHDKC